MPTQKVLVLGDGFVASLLRESIVENHTPFDLRISPVDLCDEAGLVEEIRTSGADIVINTAAKTDIDWCERNKETAFRVNVLGADRAARASAERGAYFVQFSSGCLQESRGPDDVKREDDPIDPLCFYAWTKAWAENLIFDRCRKQGLKALAIRPRLLISSRPSKRNSLLKLLTYSRFIDVEQSATVAEDMVEALWTLVQRRVTGAFNVANPGLISPFEIATMLQSAIDPKMQLVRVTRDELDRLTYVRRIRSVLSIDKLREHAIELGDVKVRTRATIDRLRLRLASAEGREAVDQTAADTRAKLRPLANGNPREGAGTECHPRSVPRTL